MPITNRLTPRAAIPEVVTEVFPRNGSPSPPAPNELTPVENQVEDAVATLSAEVERVEQARREAEAEEARARERAEAARRDAEREEARAAALREENARLEEVLLQAARAEAAEHVPDAAAPSRCVIRFWRGYRKSSFYAESEMDGEAVAVAESRFFRAGGNGVPERTDEAAAAYASLVEKLESLGWRRVQSGPAWFEATLER